MIIHALRSGHDGVSGHRCSLGALGVPALVDSVPKEVPPRGAIPSSRNGTDGRIGSQGSMRAARSRTQTHYGEPEMGGSQFEHCEEV
jgi:hypothetical protein